MSNEGYVQTVLGPVDPMDLGITLPHEHILIDMTLGYSSAPEMISATESGALAAQVPEAGYEPGEEGPGLVASFRDLWNTPITLQNRADVERNWFFYGDYKRRDPRVAIYEAELFKLAGGGCLVDQTSIGLARDPIGLQQVSRGSGVHIVMGTGFYVHEYHAPAIADFSEDQMFERILRDLEEGVAGGVKAGIVGEVGLSFPMHPDERKGLRAGARAAAQTGAALSIHPGFSQELVYEAFREVEDAGGDLSRTAISHLDERFPNAPAPDSFDPKPFLELAKTGAWLSFDTFGWETSVRQRGKVDMANDAIRLNWLLALVEAGHEDRLLISSDLAIEHWERGKGGWGWQHIPESVVQLMRYKGFDEAVINKILIENPRKYLTITK